MATQIKLRRDTAANWTSNSTVVLAAGEPGFETDTGKLKIGNGTSTWAQLSYISGEATNVSSLINGNYTVELGVDGTVNLSQVPSVGAAVIQPNDTTFGIKLVSNGNVWAYGTNGVLTLPDGSIVANGFISGSSGQAGGITNGDDGFQQFYAQGDGAYVQTSVGNLGVAFNTWQFGLDGKLKLPAGGDIVDSTGTTVLGGGGADTGDITFRTTNIIGAVESGWSNGKISLVPNQDTSYVHQGQYLDIYPTIGQDAPHIHIAAGNGDESRGDLILGNDNQYVDINHQGRIIIRSQDAMRGWTNGWTFDIDGTLNSGGTLYINGAIEAQYGHSLGLSGSYVTQATQTIQFSNANGTAKTVYTVDGNTYDLTGINLSNVMQVVVYDNGTQYTLSTSNITYDSGTHVWTFTFNTAITLQSATTYTVDWFIWAPQGVQLNGGENSWFFSPDGSVRYPQWAMQRDTGNVVCNANADTVVFTSYDTNLHTIKLLIKVEGSLSGTTWDTQSCEMIIAKSWRANTVVASVYAVVHTSPTPLATFTAQWNSTINKVEVMCRPTSSTYGVEVKTFATEITSSD